MSRTYTPKVISASHLREGVVVWLTEDDTWSRNLNEAELITDPVHAELRMLHAESQAHEVLGAHLADVVTAARDAAPAQASGGLRRRA